MPVLLVAGAVSVVGLIIIALRNGGLRMRDGRIIGRQQTQQEFDEELARLRARDAVRKEWLKRR